MSTEKKEKKGLKKLFGSRFRAGGYSVFAAVIVIAIAVMANLAVNALPTSVTQTDLTDQNLYTLSDQTKQIVKSLNSDVTLYLLASDGQEDSTVTTLLDRYADLSEHIKVEYVDPTIRPTFLDQYDLDGRSIYQNSVLVECGSKYKLVGYDEIFVTSYSYSSYSYYDYSTTTDFYGENALTTAIHYVSAETLPKAYMLTGHGEGEMDSTIEDLLKDDNFESESLSLLSMTEVPEDAAVIIINAPQSDLSEEEAEMLITYLEGGGNIVLMTDYIESGKMTNLLKVTSAMGLTVSDGIIVEGDRTRSINWYPYYILPEIGRHTTTDTLIDGGYYILVPLAQPITEVEGTSAEITWILTTSDEAYAKVAGYSMTTTEKEDGDTEGPFYVGAISESGEGKLVWFTSAEMLDSNVDAAVSGANSNLFMNILNWMSDQEESISIRAKSMDEASLTLTAAESSRWSIIMIGVIPAVLIAAGLIIYIRRKRR